MLWQIITLLLLNIQSSAIKLVINGTIVINPKNRITKHNRWFYGVEHPVRFCSDYDYIENSCRRCLQFYDLLQGACYFNKKSVTAKPRSTQFVKNQFAVLMIWSSYCESVDQYYRCTKCRSGYVYIDAYQICGQQIVRQNQKYIMIPFQIPGDSLCSILAEDGKCSECYQGSSLENGLCNFEDYSNYDCRLNQICYPIVTPCEVYSKEGFCKNCSIGSINIKGQCHKIEQIDLCYEREGNTPEGRCLVCNQQYTTNGSKGECIYKLPYCLVQKTLWNCSKCQPGYALFGGECHYLNSKLPFQSNELTCISWDKGRCVQCKEGHYMKHQACYKSDKWLEYLRAEKNTILG